LSPDLGGLPIAEKCTIHFGMVTYPPLSAPSPQDERTVPDRLVAYFSARIFTGELPAGTRLPADRDLAPMLGVDRTSLRMALQQLARLGVVRVVHGSGVSVLSFRKHAGIDFLAQVFALDDVSLGSSYLVEMLEDWIELMPVLLGRALARSSHESRRGLDATMAEQIALLDRGADMERVIELELALQDQVLDMVGNTLVVLVGNSSRPLRRNLVRRFYASIDVRAHVTMQRELFQHVMATREIPVDAVAKAYHAYLVERTAPLRERLLALPLNPSLAAPAPKRKRRGARAASRH